MLGIVCCIFIAQCVIIFIIKCCVLLIYFLVNSSGLCVELVNCLSGYIGFTINIQVETVVEMKCSMEYQMIFSIN